MDNQKIEELRAEIRITNREASMVSELDPDPITVFVEGDDDCRFYGWYLEKCNYSREVLIKQAQNVFNFSDYEKSIHDFGDTLGACDYVILGALHNKSGNAKDIYIADRDIRDQSQISHFSDKSTPDLLWTDYPAIESYACRESVLDAYNRRIHFDVLPKASTYINDVYFYLYLIFFYRKYVKNDEGEVYQKFIRVLNSDKKIDEPTWKSYFLGISQSLIPKVENIRKLSSNDLLKYCYGHEVVRVIFPFINEGLKKNEEIHNKPSEGKLERALLRIFIDENFFENEKLFLELGDILQSR